MTTQESITGLSEAEVVSRREQGLGNQTNISTSRTYWQIFRENVFTFINNVLFGLGITLVLIGRASDALVSVGVILMNVLVSVVQEIRAKRILDHIAFITRPTVTVIREGQRKKVNLDEIVRGDTLWLEPGDQVVADGTIIKEDELQVDESLLTGESDAISKRPGDTVFSGSFCVAGSGYYTADKVGADSLSNQMTASARSFRRVTTPLQREVNLIVRILLLVAAFLEILLIVNTFFEKIPIVDGIRNAVVVIGLVPNGLFLSIATAYALGAVRIARKGALIQQSNAIESLSHVDLLCFDKTGTLTTNNLLVKYLFPLRGSEEDFRRDLGNFIAGFASKNRTAAAIAEACPGAPQTVRESVPFSSVYRWSGLSIDGPDMSGMYVMGAPEIILPKISQTASLTSKITEWTNQGLRVLVFAAQHDQVPFRGPEGDLRLPPDLAPLGLIAIADELRPEARTAILDFQKAGVELKIISGDNPDTVASLARQAGIDPGEGPVSGETLSQLPTDEMGQLVKTRSIFGRIAPRQKEEMIKLLRHQGKYVAMIGDGVNDVLALKQADLAISLQGGSQAARAVADIVLLEDSFAVLPQTVREGQRILVGMQDVFKLFLTRILYECLLILATMAAGGFPLSLKHNSILTLLTVGIPTFALVLWAQPGIVPRSRMARKISHFILPPALTLALGGLIVYIGFLITPVILAGGFTLLSSLEFDPLGHELITAQTALAGFSIFCGLFLVVFVEPPTRFWVGGDKLSGDKRPAFLALFLFVVYCVILLVPSFRSFFELASLPWFDYLLLLGISALWGLGVRWLWRNRILDRYLGMSYDGVDAQ